MDHHCTTVVRDRIDRHLRPGLGLDGLRAFFASSYAPDPAAEHGCLLINTAVEYDGVDDVARAHLRSRLLEIRSAIRDLLEHVERTGGLRAGLDIDAATQTLLVLYQGLLVLLRMKDPIIDFDTIVDSAIVCIASRSKPQEKRETF